MNWIKGLVFCVAAICIFSGISYAGELFFPQVADGTSGDTSWRTTLVLSNTEYSSASVTIAFIQDDGTPMNVTVRARTSGWREQTGSVFQFTLYPIGYLQIETTGTGNMKTGWARVQSDKSIGGISIFSLYIDGNFINDVGAPATEAKNAFSFLVEKRTGINTGIVIANPNASQVMPMLILRDAGGFIVAGPSYLPIPANGHVQKYVTELFSQEDVPSDFQGILEVMGVLNGMVGMGVRQRELDFTWLPVIPQDGDPIFRELSASVHRLQEQGGFLGLCGDFRFLPTNAGEPLVSD